MVSRKDSPFSPIEYIALMLGNLNEVPYHFKQGLNKLKKMM